MMRLVGTTEVTLNPDPKEFVGLSVDRAAQVLQKMLEEEYPGVDIPFNDIVMEADRLVTEVAGVSRSN